MNFTHWKRIATSLALAVVIGVLPASGPAQAQITPEDFQELEERFRSLPPEQQRQIEERMRSLSREQIQQLADRYSKMTPEQRRLMQDRFLGPQQGGGGEGGDGGGGRRSWEPAVNVSSEDRQRYLMISARITDRDVQNAIIAFVAEQSKQRQPVTEAALKLSALLADETASSESIGDQQEELSAASKAFRAWKEGALKTLDTKIGYSKNPRFHSLLVLVGIIGDEASDAGGFNTIFPKGVAGDGDITDFIPGRGGQNRGNRGWRGGPPEP